MSKKCYPDNFSGQIFRENSIQIRTSGTTEIQIQPGYLSRHISSKSSIQIRTSNTTDVDTTEMDHLAV